MSVRIMVGHVLDMLAELPDESVHMVVTSPPYYGLRDYGIEPQVWGGDPNCEHEWGEWREKRDIREETIHGKTRTTERFYGDESRRFDGNHQKITAGQFCQKCGCWRGSLGLEPTLDLYLDHMVEIMREVRRVMRKDATCWLNIGDSYANDGKWGGHTGGKHVKALHNSPIGRNKKYTGFKPKDLMLIPPRLAIRLCDDGWWVRSDIIWAKRAPMPESVTDRPTSAHEHVFLLTKSAHYYYDAEAVKEESETDPKENYPARARVTDRGMLGSSAEARGSDRNSSGGFPINGKRNLRNVWHLGPEPFPEAHFATFVSEIPRRAILAGTSERGVCPKCGAPWARVTKSSFHQTQNGTKGSHQKGLDASSGWTETPRGANETETIGWRPTCGCDAGDPAPATCLDPFLGAGTTALVADRLGRDCIGIELNPEYAEMARRRIESDAGLFAQVLDSRATAPLTLAGEGDRTSG